MAVSLAYVQDIARRAQEAGYSDAPTWARALRADGYSQRAAADCIGVSQSCIDTWTDGVPRGAHKRVARHVLRCESCKQSAACMRSVLAGGPALRCEEES
jgi:hypothetical protein